MNHYSSFLNPSNYEITQLAYKTTKVECGKRVTLNFVNPNEPVTCEDCNKRIKERDEGLAFLKAFNN